MVDGASTGVHSNLGGVKGLCAAASIWSIAFQAVLGLSSRGNESHRRNTEGWSPQCLIWGTVIPSRSSCSNTELTSSSTTVRPALLVARRTKTYVGRLCSGARVSVVSFSLAETSPHVFTGSQLAVGEGIHGAFPLADKSPRGHNQSCRG